MSGKNNNNNNNNNNRNHNHNHNHNNKADLPYECWLILADEKIGGFLYSENQLLHV